MKKLNLAIIVAGGNCRDKKSKELLKAANWIIAADGGANSCLKLGILPNQVIGDFDSITKKNLQKLKNQKQTEIIFDPDQNKTDLELAIKTLNKLQPKNAIILGALGNRFDHTLANIISLNKINKKINLKIIDKNHQIFLVNKKITITGKSKDIISIIPLIATSGLTYQGLKWPLTNQKVNWGWIGIRNQMLGKKVTISLKSGLILVIKTTK